MSRPSKANLFMLLFLVYEAFLPWLLALTVYPLTGSYDAYKKAVVLIGDIFMFGLPILVFCRIEKRSILSIVPHRPLSLLSIVLIVLISFFMMPLMNFAAYVSMLFAEPESSNIIRSYAADNTLIYMVTAVAVMPAFFEELTFRGVIMSYFKRCGMFWAVLVSALYFGIMHLDLYQLIYAIVAGCIFGMMVQYTDSIFASMLAHFIINGVQVLALMLIKDPAVQEAAQAASETVNAELIRQAAELAAYTFPVMLLLLYALRAANNGRETDYKYSLTDKSEFQSDICESKETPLDFSFFAVLFFYFGYMYLERIYNKM